MTWCSPRPTPEQRMRELKGLVRKAAHAVGIEISRYRRGHPFGVSPWADIPALLSDVTRPIVFDVGANIGQSVHKFSELMPGCELHAFEPAPNTFRQLETNTRQIRNLHLVNAGVGSASGTEALIENDHPYMSSILRPGPAAWGTIVGETPIRVTSLDEYCTAQNVATIHLLKTDTQGYDLEVLKGCAGLMSRRAVQLVYTELIFSEMYEGMAPVDHLYRFLYDRGFQLVAVYDLTIRNGVAGWCDALFRSDLR